jgi:hypothetical protein
MKMRPKIFFLAAGLILNGCATDQCAPLAAAGYDASQCYASQREARWRAVAIASGSMSNSLGDMQGLAEQNQRSSQMLIDQTQQFPRFQPPDPVPPVGADHGWGSAAPSPPPGYVSSPDPGLGPLYFVPPPPGVNANQLGVAP